MQNIQDYPQTPLLRLKIEYTGGYQPVNVTRFSEQFKGRIANFSSFLFFYKRKDYGKKFAKDQKKQADVHCLSSRVVDQSDPRAELTACLEDTIQERQIGDLYKPDKRILDMPGHVFSKLVNHEIEQKSGSLEKFYDNLFASTRNHDMKIMIERLEGGSFDLEEMQRKQDFTEVTQMIHHESTSFMVQNGILLEEHLNNLKEVAKAQKVSQVNEDREDSEFNQVFSKANGDDAMSSEDEVENKKKPRQRSATKAAKSQFEFSDEEVEQQPKPKNKGGRPKKKQEADDVSEKPVKQTRKKQAKSV